MLMMQSLNAELHNANNCVTTLHSSRQRTRHEPLGGSLTINPGERGLPLIGPSKMPQDEQRQSTTVESTLPFQVGWAKPSEAKHNKKRKKVKESSSVLRSRDSSKSPSTRDSISPDLWKFFKADTFLKMTRRMQD